MDTQFYVSHDGSSLGPWSLTEIVERMGRLEITATDFIYDESAGSWVPLMQFQPIVEFMNSRKPSAPPPRATQKPDGQPKAKHTQVLQPQVEVQADRTAAGMEDAEWFVMKDSHRFGPFTYAGLVKALQEKTVFEYEFAWKQGMDNWVRLAEISDFSAERIRTFMSEAAQIFFNRQYARFNYDCDVLVHNDHQVWTGRTYQGGEGGSGLIIHNAMITPGQNLLVHFAATEKLPAFKAIVEVVSKRFVKDLKDKRTPVPYGVRFVKIDDDTREAIRRHSASAA